MPFLLTLSSTVLCMHGGQAQATAPYPRVLVDGQPVVTLAAPHTVAGCPYVVPGPSPMPCVTAQWVMGATRVLAGGQPVLLQNSTAVCVPNGTGVNIVMTQLRVQGQ